MSLPSLSRLRGSFTRTDGIFSNCMAAKLPDRIGSSRSPSMIMQSCPSSPRWMTGLGAAAVFAAKASGVVTAGMLFSGISIIDVTPPAAAAMVADRNPSHSVRPGSLMWTWVSTNPGTITASPKSNCSPCWKSE